MAPYEGHATPEQQREFCLTRTRKDLTRARRELQRLKAYVASDAVQHAINLLDRTREGDGNRR